MNRRSLPAVLLAVCATLVFTASVSAMYHPTLGRFAQRDPKGYVDGMSLYQYVRGAPTNSCDPTGLLDAQWVNQPQYVAGKSPGNDVAYAGIAYSLSSGELGQISDGGGKAYIVQKRTTTWSAGTGGVPEVETTVYTSQIAVAPNPKNSGALEARGDGMMTGVAMTDGSVAARYTSLMMNLNQAYEETSTPEGGPKGNIDGWMDSLRSGPRQSGSVEVKLETSVVLGDGKEAIAAAKEAADKAATKSGGTRSPADLLSFAKVM